MKFYISENEKIAVDYLTANIGIDFKLEIRLFVIEKIKESLKYSIVKKDLNDRNFDINKLEKIEKHLRSKRGN